MDRQQGKRGQAADKDRHTETDKERTGGVEGGSQTHNTTVMLCDCGTDTQGWTNSK